MKRFMLAIIVGLATYNNAFAQIPATEAWYNTVETLGAKGGILIGSSVQNDAVDSIVENTETVEELIPLSQWVSPDKRIEVLWVALERSYTKEHLKKIEDELVAYDYEYPAKSEMRKERQKLLDACAKKRQGL